ncbi:hypothetical protein OsJ_17102 [Oryza sativa Japonica Group]|uniref:Uncharacterized protein n=1 Tax=Oryza sativa subsp. japonica TaxID=39947 RepID=B9FME8_ORYSJ|nr:hypothetical protein OsJ_17102 [Oryza sativa Japonica Group]
MEAMVTGESGLPAPHASLLPPPPDAALDGLDVGVKVGHLPADDGLDVGGEVVDAWGWDNHSNGGMSK